MNRSGPTLQDSIHCSKYLQSCNTNFIIVKYALPIHCTWPFFYNTQQTNSTMCLWQTLIKDSCASWCSCKINSWSRWWHIKDEICWLACHVRLLITLPINFSNQGIPISSSLYSLIIKKGIATSTATSCLTKPDVHRVIFQFPVSRDTFVVQESQEEDLNNKVRPIRWQLSCGWIGSRAGVRNRWFVRQQSLYCYYINTHIIKPWSQRVCVCVCVCACVRARLCNKKAFWNALYKLSNNITAARIWDNMLHRTGNWQSLKKLSCANMLLWNVFRIFTPGGEEHETRETVGQCPLFSTQ